MEHTLSLAGSTSSRQALRSVTGPGGQEKESSAATARSPSRWTMR